MAWFVAGLLAVGALAAHARGADTTPTESRPLHLVGKDAGAKPDSHATPDGLTPLKSAGNEQHLGGTVTQTVLALGAVVGVILVLGLVVKRFARRSGGIMSALGPGGRAPSGLLEVLGRYPVARGTTLVLLKMDRRILLLCQSGGGKLGGGAGMSTLCEVIDPEEVASILLKTRDEEGESLAQRFQSMLKGEERSADEVLEAPSARSAQAGITGPDSFELTQARAKKPAAAIRTRLDSLRQPSATAAGVRAR